MKKNTYLCRENNQKQWIAMNEKIQIDIYKGLPMILEKVKSVALSAVIGKSNAWLNNKLNRYTLNSKDYAFTENDLPLINRGLESLGSEIAQSMILFGEDRDAVIDQAKELSSYVVMPYICEKVMGKSARWCQSRMARRAPGKKACSFKEEDILQINMVAMQIANELRSIEFVLK